MLAAVLLLPQLARAGEDRALQLYQLGREAYVMGDLEEAAQRFEASLNLRRHPNTLLNLGMTYERMGRPADAIEKLEAYLSEGRPDNAAHIRARIERIRRTPSPLEVLSEPLGALLFIDGAEAPAGATPFRGELPPGRHALRLVREGFEVAELHLDVPFGAPAQQRVTLVPKAATLVARSQQTDAVLTVDGAAAADLPQRMTLQPGVRRLRVETPRGAASLRLQPRAGDAVEIELNIPKAEKPLAPPPPADPPALGIALRTGPVFTLDAGDEAVPASAAVGLLARYRLSCERLCLLANLELEVTPLGRSDRARADRRAQAFLLALIPGFSASLPVWPTLRLEVRSGVGTVAVLGVPDGGRLSWFPEDTYARDGGLWAPAFAAELLLRWRALSWGELSFSPLSFVQAVSRGGLDRVPGGLSRLGARLGVLLWL